MVYNLSDHSLDKATLSALEKGLHFAVAPSRLPIEEIVTGVEVALTTLSKSNAKTYVSARMKSYARQTC